MKRVKIRDSGCYQILIHLDKSSKIRVGRLGRFDFPAGWYVYTGSAMGGLSARLGRHLSRDKKQHWHIDYLLQFAHVRGIKKCLTTKRKECSLSRRLFVCLKGAMIVKKFGSSDCRCQTHLAYFKNKPDIQFEMTRQKS